MSTELQRQLPPNIYVKRDSFEIKVNYKTKIFRAYALTLQEAIKKLEEIKKQIEDLKKDNLQIHNEREIERNENGVAIIPIVNRKGEIVAYTTVSDNQWHRLMQYSWNKSSDNYVTTSINQKYVRLHRYIMDAPDDKIVDHIDNNRLNNTTENLRCTNYVVNNHNKAKKITATSQYFGVSFNKKQNVWKAEIRKDTVRHYVGQFKTELQAALSYNVKASELYGDHAKLNVFNEDIEDKFNSLKIN